MEMWVLIAAAGSGYLVHCWRNLQKSKEAASDVSDDNNDLSSMCSCVDSSRKSHTRACRCLKVGSYQNSFVSELGDNAGKCNDGHLYGLMGVDGCNDGHLYGLMGVDAETNGAQDMENGAELDAAGSMTSSHFTILLDAAISQTTNGESSTSSPSRCTYDTVCAQQCGSSELFGQNDKAHEFMADSFSDCLDRSLMTWDRAESLGAFSLSGSCSMLRNEHRVNSMDDVVNNNVINNNAINEGEDTWLDDQLWASGYWNAKKDTYVSETSTPVTFREHGCKRKVRRFHEVGRRGYFTWENGSIKGVLPISSSDSCLSVYFGGDHNQEQIVGGISASSCGEQPSNGIGNFLGIELLEGTVSDNLLRKKNHVFLARPEGSRVLRESTNCESLAVEEAMEKNHVFLARAEGSRVLRESTNCESLAVEEAMENSHLPCLPLQSKKRKWENAWRKCMPTPGGGNFDLPGSANSLLKALLFNFGVGVGMMLTIFSNERCTRKATARLEDTLHVLQGLQDEIRGRTKRLLEYYQLKDTIEAVWAVEQMSALFEGVARILDVVEHLKVLVSEDFACNSPLDDKLSDARAKLEAELEAELERMEWNLCMEDASEFPSRNPCDDPIIGNLIHGELSEIGHPPDAVVGSGSSSDGGDSCFEVPHNGVPASELARRLRDLLVANQEGEILELQAKVEGLDRRLQAKQAELQLWKQRALNAPLPEMELPSDRRVKPCCCTENLCSCNNPRVRPLIRQCFHEEADEDYVDISCFSCETAIGSNSMPPTGLFIDAYGDGDQKSRGICSHEEVDSTGYLNDATDASSDSYGESVHGRAILHDHPQGTLEHKIRAAEKSRRKRGPNAAGKGKVVPVSGASYNLTQENKPADRVEGVRNLCQNPWLYRHELNWSTTSEESSSYSDDLDEKMGQILIKRIVEKGKRASSIVEVAQSVMASFDGDDTIHDRVISE